MPQDNQPTNLKSREEIFEDFLSLVREGHEAVVNEEEVDKYYSKVKSHISTIRQEDLEVIEKWAENKKQPYWTGNLTAEKQLINRDIAYQNQLLNDLLSFITYQKTRV